MSIRNDMYAEIQNVLAELGDTPDKIAEKLSELEISGWIGNPVFCPIARYLGRKGYNIAVTHTKLIVYGSILFDVPTNIGEFIRLFDRGKYPALQSAF